MGDQLVRLALGAIISVGATVAQDAHARADGWKPRHVAPVQLGPRPFYLVEQLSDGELKRSERPRGSFHRRFTLPETADADAITARTGHGVLTIDIPKRTQPTPRRIQVGS